jgi:hypothetical protein
MATKESLKTTDTYSLTSEDLKKLKAPFPKDRLGVKVQSFNREKTRAMLVLYLQHTDVQDRLEEVDPSWSCEVLSEERAGDTVYVRSRMVLKGVARENVGEGFDPKAAYSDALKRCAMLFGVGRYLYDSPTVWADYDDSRDRFKQWSVDDYEASLKRFEKPGLTRDTPKEPVAPASASKPAKASAKAAAPSSGSTGPRPREELNRILMNLYRPYLTQFPDTQFATLLKQRYGVGETRLMAVEQLEDLVKFMEQKMKSAA